MIHMRFTGDQGSFETTMTPEVVEALEERRWLYDEREDNDEGVHVSIERLREETDRVLRDLKNGPPIYTYLASEMVETPRGLVKHESTGAICGLQIDGQTYALEAGYNRCVLLRFCIDERGIGYCASEEDARDRDYIDTDNRGRISIRKRRSTGPPARWLGRIAKKTADWAGDVSIEFG